jgi:hypothetical protein
MNYELNSVIMQKAVHSGQPFVVQKNKNMMLIVNVWGIYNGKAEEHPL